MSIKSLRPLWLLGLFFFLVGYGPPVNIPDQEVPVSVEVIPLRNPAQPCGDTFVTHTLNHITTVPGGDQVRMFEANGSGVAINDLDNDGDLDIVLANHRDPNTVLWNEGNLTFLSERMASGDSRAVNIVDVDGDGWLDIIFTRRASAPNYWRNTGEAGNPPFNKDDTRLAAQFEQTFLPGISQPAYAMNWADLDGDGDLDWVTGSYDAALLTDLGNDFLLKSDAGLFYHENRGGKFYSRQLAPGAQAMAVAFLDLNADQQLDILVGNDFAVPDMAWLRQGKAWLKSEPFSSTSHSTMSLAWADIDNNGHWELFSGDMKPYAGESPAGWERLMADMEHAPMPGDLQIMENVLQIPIAPGEYRNEAARWGVDATGWSWSAKFGDLDNDGYVDLYAVNGMIEARMFAHLPDHELVERNQARRNNGWGRFEPAPEWALDSTLSGRGMSMADLDQDGDLDIVVNNLRGPAQLFENRLCGGSSIEVDLFWPGSGNTRAIGATVILQTGRGNYYRRVRAAGGYLSGDPARLHFGFPAQTTLHALEIRWPDDQVSSVGSIPPKTHLNITR